jgi:D-alanyl-lipoteichoic acid acyltransferase DltB (MBOAT superfamily)
MSALLYIASRAVSLQLSKIIMIGLSLVFYCYLTTKYMPVLLASCAINYCLYKLMQIDAYSRVALWVGILLNAVSLCYFKYVFFVVSQLSIKDAEWTYALGLPLAVSFFTFQQISFLVDSYTKKIIKVNGVDYLYYITFFPKLIAGPITRYNDLVPQASSRSNNYSMLFIGGLSILSVGLFKKIVMSAIFARYADIGYASHESLGMIEAWCATLSYTAQIYFDFSGYSDIAIGSAMLLGIRLPDNFNSPYKAVNIRDFWSRWHISLSTWLRDYVYIPLGGSRAGFPRTMANVIITFLVSGAWHGSHINFIIWGILHGAATCINITWGKLGFSMPKIAGIVITFLFINLSWIPFRAESLESAMNMVSALFNFGSLVIVWHENNLSLAQYVVGSIFNPTHLDLIALFLSIFSTASFMTLKNSTQIAESIMKQRYSSILIAISSAAFVISIVFMFGGASESQFIYAAF